VLAEEAKKDVIGKEKTHRQKKASVLGLSLGFRVQSRKGKEGGEGKFLSKKRFVKE